MLLPLPYLVSKRRSRRERAVRSERHFGDVSQVECSKEVSEGHGRVGPQWAVRGLVRMRDAHEELVGPPGVRRQDFELRRDWSSKAGVHGGISRHPRRGGGGTERGELLQGAQHDVPDRSTASGGSGGSDVKGEAVQTSDDEAVAVKTGLIEGLADAAPVVSEDAAVNLEEHSRSGSGVCAGEEEGAGLM
jgi:hypothetical protein